MLRSSRVMVSLFLLRDDHMLLLFRRNSRAVADSWVGIGGHVESTEITDSTSAVLRELSEELDIPASAVTELSLRYVSVRDNGTEIRTTYYYTGHLPTDIALPERCDEGDLGWFPVSALPGDLVMPPTTRAALTHWVAEGRLDDAVRLIAGPLGEPVVVR